MGLVLPLSALATPWAREQAPPSFSDRIPGPPVTALRKQYKDARQIAVGETLRRMVIWVLLHREIDNTCCYLAPHQQGAGT